MTPDGQLPIEEVRARLFGPTTAEAKQVVYSISEAAEVWGVPVSTVRARINDGTIRLRNNGGHYLVPGGLILDVLGVEAHPKVNDHRQHITARHLYTIRDLGALFGISYDAAQRLVRSARVTPDRVKPRSLFYGETLLDYLAGSDEPLRHQASA